MLVRRVWRYSRIFYSWRVRKSAVPSYLAEDINVEVTNTCNFRCKFCPQSDPRHHEHVPRVFLDAEKAELIFNRLREGGVSTDTLHWTLDGEPFMNKEFHKLCAVAIKYKFKNMFFATNGMLLTEERLRELPAGSEARYTFRIDYCADPSYFEEVRGRKGSWQVILENIRSSLRNSFQSNFRFQLSDITSYRSSDPAILHREFEKLKSLFPKSPRISFRGKTFHNSAGLTAARDARKPKRRYHTCPYPWTSLVVASDGRAVACCRDLRRQTVLGNILDQPLDEVWRGEPYRELRRNLARGAPWQSQACAGCDMPYDDSKFSFRNFMRTARGRLQIFRA